MQNIEWGLYHPTSLTLNSTLQKDSENTENQHKAVHTLTNGCKHKQ